MAPHFHSWGPSAGGSQSYCTPLQSTWGLINGTLMETWQRSSPCLLRGSISLGDALLTSYITFIAVGIWVCHRDALQNVINGKRIAAESVGVFLGNRQKRLKPTGRLMAAFLWVHFVLQAINT